jgi:hypothetical protein
MPVKAPPPPPPPPPSWWSGFVELDGESFLINPQGQALIPHGSATLVAGLNLTLYKDKAGFINNVTVGGLVATDWSGSFSGYWGPAFVQATGPSANGALFDTVFALSQAVTFGQYWTLENVFFNVASDDVQTHACAPLTGATAGACGTFYSGNSTLIWDTVKLSLNDSFTGWPITFHPYVNFWYELSDLYPGNAAGDGTAACFACSENNWDVFIGIEPTLSLEKYWGIPVTLKAPTYVTVGPSSFWQRSTGIAAFGTSSGGVGTFTTGLNATVPLSWMPAPYGHWYVKAGFQWYDVINSALQASNALSVGGVVTGGGCGTVSASNCSSIFVGYGGIGVAF